MLTMYSSKEEHDPKKLAQEKVLRADRKALRKNWNVNSLSANSKARVNRAIQGIVRKKNKLKIYKKRLDIEEQILILRDMRPSVLMDRLYPERTKKNGWKRLLDRDLEDKDQEINLENFSFLADPQETITNLRKIARAEALAPGTKLNFMDSYCLDVCPFMLLVECWDEILPIFEGGRMDFPMQKVLASVGIHEAMGIGLNGVNNFNDVWSFPLTRRREEGSTKSKQPYLDAQTREIATDRFCSALDAWLSRPEIGLELNRVGNGWVKGLLGEVLENAERHSDGNREDGSWSVSGFMARRKRRNTNEWDYHAHIGIVSIGDTFSESLERASTSQKEKINNYVSEMKKKKAPQSDETLRTLAALQDGVTCYASADEDGRGGYGLMEMLDMVCILGGTESANLRPKVTIISGGSCIKLSYPYIRGMRTEGTKDPREQWFNKANTAAEPPDEQFVFDVDPGLPGTIISIGFVLDPAYFNRVVFAGA